MKQYITVYVDDKNTKHTNFNRTMPEALREKARANKKGYECRLVVREIKFLEPLVLYKQER